MQERIYCRKCGKDVQTLNKRRHYCRSKKSRHPQSSGKQAVFTAQGIAVLDRYQYERLWQKKFVE